MLAKNHLHHLLSKFHCSIAACLAHDNDNCKVEQALLKKDAVQRLVKFFQCCSEQQFAHILEPFLKIITSFGMRAAQIISISFVFIEGRKSSRINTTLAVNGLIPLLIVSLDHQRMLKLMKRSPSLSHAQAQSSEIPPPPLLLFFASSLLITEGTERMAKGLIWATAEDLARNRGRVLSLYRQILRSLNSPSLPLNLAERLAKKAEVRAIFMLGSEETSVHNIEDLFDTAEYALSILKKGEIPNTRNPL
ncbi:hypothetical protein POTOM_021011 [Populus tomentosa]|uniref:LYR motif containing domain-containing protein n=2 Tax=Populus TaxID=3689 RepID=A0A8X7ZR59_POPTO|nr:hypothetical protein POTOM_021011 [Populus tomentosa]